jgi:hypothetical protein
MTNSQIVSSNDRSSWEQKTLWPHTSEILQLQHMQIYYQFSMWFLPEAWARWQKIWTITREGNPNNPLWVMCFGSNRTMRSWIPKRMTWIQCINCHWHDV